ncbi:MAG: GreA/GreB family elongation factor [Deltaproteobacteria bacterium]|nr:GreA/GreB family elongation factor [Deltaproteobacteria bacterium]
MTAAATEAREGATPAERREDSRVMQENAGLARGYRARLERATGELDVLERFRPPRFSAKASVALGAIVEVEDGAEGRTLFLAPVGAGLELTGPGGDGYLSVITPTSPIGRALIGRRLNDTIEVTVNDEITDWTIVHIE